MLLVKFSLETRHLCFCWRVAVCISILKTLTSFTTFFLLQTLIQSFQGFLSFLPFSPSLSPSLPSLPSSFTSFLFLRSGGEDATPLLAAIYKYKTKGTFPLWICLLDCLLFNWSLGKSLEFF